MIEPGYGNGAISQCAIECPACGCKEFHICRHGIHLGAHCKECGELIKGDYWTRWINFIEDKPDELATDKQTQYIRYLVYHKSENLTLTDAGDIIGIIEKSQKRERSLKK